MARLADWARAGRGGWRFTGAERPRFAQPPGAGQESVWDYPRPPRLAPDSRRVVVRAGDIVVVDTTRAVRVLETASPPTFYLPPDDIAMELLEPAPGASRCEWKGEARYWSVVTNDGRIDACGWSYPDPFPEFEPIRDYVSFYPARLACTVDGHVVEPQPGRFYGGWVTPELVGPFKGEPGSEGW